MKTACQITFETHLDFHEGRAESKVVRQISDHLSQGCDACRKSQDWIASFFPTLHTVVSSEVPSVSEWALNRAYRIMPVRADSPVQRLVKAAQLLFDSRQRTPALATARDAQDGSVHAVYRTDIADLDVWQEPSQNGSWYITGEALSLTNRPLDPPVRATLYSSKIADQIATIEDSEFSFDSVASGAYSLRLQWDTIEIEVDDLRVGYMEGE